MNFRRFPQPLANKKCNISEFGRPHIISIVAKLDVIYKEEDIFIRGEKRAQNVSLVFFARNFEVISSIFLAVVSEVHSSGG